MNTASLIEWVMNSPAKPSAWNSSSVWSLRCSRVISSTAPNGSSNRNTGGFSVSVRASEQRIRMPPGQRLRVVLLEAGQPDHLDRRLGQSLPLGLVDAAQLGQQLDVLADGAPRQQRGVLEHVAEVVAVDRDGARRSARSRPEAMRSSVDLPHPDGPTMVTNSSGPTSNDTSSMARVPSANVISMWSNAMPDALDGGARRRVPWHAVSSRSRCPGPIVASRGTRATGRPRVTAAAGVPGIASIHCASADLARPPRARGHRRGPAGDGGGRRRRAAHLVDGQRPRRAAGRPPAVPAAGPAVVRLRLAGQRDLRVRAGEQPADRPVAGARSRSSTPSSPSRTGSSTSTTASTSAASCGRRCRTSPPTRPSRARRRSPCRWSRTTSWPASSATAATSCCRSTTR